jgi:hypothetical protein
MDIPSNPEEKTEILVKMSQQDKTIIQNASKLLSLGASSFCRSVSLERAREIILKNSRN